MPNVATVQFLEQGQRNCIAQLVGVLDTSNETAVLKIDVSALTPPCTEVRIWRIEYAISDQLAIQLLWDATAAVTAVTMTGRGKFNFRDAGGIRNNAGAGKTGDILLTTTGWASGVQTYDIKLWLKKVGVSG